MNAAEINLICAKSQQLIELLDGVSPEVSTQVFSLVLAGRPNEEIVAIIKATKSTYQRLTGRELYEKVPKFKINITRS
jgi:hypothetical protein